MIRYFSETNYKMKNKRVHKNWLLEVVRTEGKKIGDINFVFYSDEQLLALNKQYLNHDTFTDIITFDSSERNVINGDIFISIERVKDNAKQYKIEFETELRRVLVHGILHLCGYKDKSKEEKTQMKTKENSALFAFGNKPKQK